MLKLDIKLRKTMNKFTLLILIKISFISTLWSSNNQLCPPKYDENKASIFASLLYWKANEEISSSWANNFLKTTPNVIEEGYYNPEGVYFNWNPGLRLGANYLLSCNKYEIKGYWTHYQTSSNQTSAISSLGAIIFSQFFEGFLAGDLAVGGKVNWNLKYDMFDLELAKTFKVLNEVSFRPFIGIKGGFINQSINSEFLDLYPDFLHIGYENLTNNFYGIGPSMGIETNWELLSDCLSYINLFGNFSIATQWGNWSCSDVYYNDSTYVKSSISGISNSPFGAISLSSILGLSWDYYFNQKQKLCLQAGWEIQYWVNQLRLPTFQLLRLHGDLVLQGATVNCRFDF